MPALCLRPSASCDGFATGRVWIRDTRRRDAPRMPTLRPRQTALYVLTGLLVLGALIAVGLLKSAPAPSANAAPVDEEVAAFEEAA